MKVRIFRAKDTSFPKESAEQTLEKQVNKWLEEFPFVKIIQLQQNVLTHDPGGNCKEEKEIFLTIAYDH